MDNTTNVHLVPFLGLLNLIKVKYLDTPEVFRTLITILCDFNPQHQECMSRTKRYVRTLLLREPDLAQCLVTFLEEPQLNVSPDAGRLDLSSAPDSGTPQTHTEENCNNNASTSTETQTILPEPDTVSMASPKASSQVPESCAASQVASPTAANSSKCTLCDSANSTGRSLSANADTTDAGPCSACGATKAARAGDSQEGSAFTTGGAPKSRHSVKSRAQTSASAAAAASARAGMPSHPFTLCDLRNAGLLHASWADTCGTAAAYVAMPMTLPCLVPTPLLPAAACVRLPPLDAASLSKAGTSRLPTANRAKLPAATVSAAAASLLVMPSVQSAGTVSADSEATGVQMNNQSPLPSTTITSSTTTSGLPSSKATPPVPETRVHSSGLSSEDQEVAAQPLAVHASTPASLATLQSTVASVEGGLAPSSSPQVNCTSTLCLSQLLGQPTVAPLPAGSFLDKRNNIVGGSGFKTSGEKPLDDTAKETAVLSSRTNVPLQLLSAKAGSKGSFKSTFTPPLSSSGTGALGTTRVAPILHSSSIFSPGVAFSESPASGGSLLADKSQTLPPSIDSSRSLASFPYIQQMVLPDGQVSCVSLHRSQIMSSIPTEPSPMPLPSTQKSRNVPVKLSLHKTVSSQRSTSPGTVPEFCGFKNQETDEISKKTKKYSKAGSKFVYTLPDGKQTSSDRLISAEHENMDIVDNPQDVVQCSTPVSRGGFAKIKAKRKRSNLAGKKLPVISRSTTKLNADNV